MQAANYPIPIRPRSSSLRRVKKRRRILTASVVLIATAMIEFFLVKERAGAESDIVGIWRLFLIMILAILLALGQNAIRWLTVVITGVCFAGGFITTARFLASGYFGSDRGLVLITLMTVTIAYANISAFLAFSSGVSREIRRIAERIPYT
jgi:hypothetical protein